MTGSPRIPSSSNPAFLRWSPPSTPEQPLSPRLLPQHPAEVGLKRPSALAFEAEHSPNKLRRLASPASRWHAQVPTDFALVQTDADAATTAALGTDSLPIDLLDDPQHAVWAHPFTANVDVDVDAFLDDDLGLVSDPHSATDELTAPETGLHAGQGLGPASTLSEAHLNVISHLSAAGHEALDTALVTKFLAYLTRLNLDWDTLRGDTRQRRPLALEVEVNTAINKKKMELVLRVVLNRVYGLRLRANNGARLGWTPKQPAHLKVLEQDAIKTASRPYVVIVSNLLGYLEDQDMDWHVISQPKPHDHQQRPLALEDWIAKAIADGELDSKTRAIVNRLFNFLLKPPSADNYILSEHTELVKQYSEKLVGKLKSNTVCFLSYLETIGSCWSHEVECLPCNVNPKRPIRLEDTVNHASSTAAGKLISSETRSSLNKVFGLELESAVFCKPKIPEHIELLERISGRVSATYKKIILRFFVRLEKEGTLFSNLTRLKPGDIQSQPSNLEAMVNGFIESGQSDKALRTVLNTAFGFRLGCLSRLSWVSVNAAPAHQ
jgi:hypothetical protein